MLLSAREMKASKARQSKKCMWCGEYFKVNDSITLVIPESRLKAMYKKLAYNCILHTEEYKKLEESGSEEFIIQSLAHRSTPRVKNTLSEYQNKRLDCFRIVCDSLGFRVETTQGVLLKRRQHGTSMTISLNIRTGAISTSRKGRTSIIDSMYKLQFEIQVINKLKAMMGEEGVEEFKAEAVIANAITETKR